MIGEQLLLFDDSDFEQPPAKPKKVVVIPHFPAPKNDNEKLLELQFQYKNGNNEALCQIYDLSVSICLKMVNTKAKDNAKVARLTLAEKKLKAHDSAMYIVERLMSDVDFVINKSFTGYLYLRVLHELFYQSKADTVVDYVDLNQFFKEEEDAFYEAE